MPNSKNLFEKSSFLKKISLLPIAYGTSGDANYSTLFSTSREQLINLTLVAIISLNLVLYFLIRTHRPVYHSSSRGKKRKSRSKK